MTLNLNSLPLGARANSHSNGDSSKIQLIFVAPLCKFQKAANSGRTNESRAEGSDISLLPVALQAVCKHNMLCGASVAFVRETENLLRLNPSSLNQAFKIIHHNFCVS